MLKRFRIYIIVAVFLVLLGIYYIVERTVIFNWVNPYTNTAGFSHIAKTIKEIERGLNFAKKNSVQEGFKINYIFQNAYGSGFLNNNPIPNDLDYAVGIDLGEYTYDGNNAKEIASAIVDKMDSFQYGFNIYINEFLNGNIYAENSQFEILAILMNRHNETVKEIVQYLPQALSGKDYVVYTNKDLEGHMVDLPYIMKANEILVQDYDPIMLYSENLDYNSSMPHYMRSISIIPEYFVRINYKGKVSTVEVVPESFVGERLQLSRRFFGSSTFPGIYSKKFLKMVKYVNDEENYFKYRMFSYKRHLQEISNIEAVQDRPIKMFKRIQQTVDIISPMLDDKTKTEIGEIVLKNMSNRDIQLINEYQNICTNYILIMRHPNLYLKLLQNGKIEKMYNVLLSSVDELKQRGNVDSKKLEVLDLYAQKYLRKLFAINTHEDVVVYSKHIFEDNYKVINETSNSIVYSLMQDKEKLTNYINMFSKIYTDAGYHKISLYWLANNKMGILKDDFTKNIKDIKQFAKDNDLADVEYKLVTPSDLPEIAVKYGMWTRYNPTEQQEQKYQLMRQKLLEDRKNFNIKQKIIF